MAAGGPGYDPEAGLAASFAAEFANEKVRAAFVRKVLGIVFLQLAVTAAVGIVCAYVQPVKVSWPLYLALESVDGQRGPCLARLRSRVLQQNVSLLWQLVPLGFMSPLANRAVLPVAVVERPKDSLLLLLRVVCTGM